MSKYNLTDSLIEYIGGGRIGTLKISFKDLQDKMDELERSGKVIVREIPGPSGDLKVNREFEVVDRDSAVAGGNKQERGFTVYDYKFGFDPGSQAEFMNEYPFSVGGNDLRLAMELIDGVEPYGINEEEELTKSEKSKLKKVSSQLKKSVKAHDKQSKVIDKIVNEENVIKDLAMADEVIKMIKMMNPDVRQDLLMKLARMGQKMDENRREKNPVGMGQLYVQPAVQKEIKRQLDAYDKGDMDVDDLINGIEEIIFGYVKAPGMNESTGPSDKAETEDDVVNIDKVASPSAKGVGYGAETSANTAEDDMEDKEIANPRPMYEINYDAIDQAMKGGEFAKKLGKLKGTLDFKIGLEKLESALNKNKDISGEEALAAIGKELKMPEKDEVKENGDTEDFTNELKENMYIDDDEFEMEMVMDRAKEIAPILKGVDMDIIVDFVKTHRQDIRGASDEEIRDEFEEFRSVNYDYIDEDLKNQFKRFM